MSTSTNCARSFPQYLKTALEFSLQAEKQKTDDGDLALFNERCRKGVAANWAALTAEDFLKTYLWCVGGIMQRYTINLKYFDQRVALFRNCSAGDIVRDTAAIRLEWSNAKRGLNEKKVEAVLLTAKLVTDAGWETFLNQYLPLPENSQSEDPGDWYATYAALDRLPMVGAALAWFMIRNLLGVPVFKLDVHIVRIASEFFGDSSDPVRALTDAAKHYWPKVCADRRFLPVHLGEVDYILWFYRRSGEPHGDDDKLRHDAMSLIDDAPITREAIDGLVSFLPALGTPGPHSKPEWKGMEHEPGTNTFIMPYPCYPKVVEDFFQLASQRCWTDYGNYLATAAELIHDDTAIASASLAQIKTMLTFCVRGERFCDGHWDEMVQEGRIGAILYRLQQLRDTIP